MTMPCESEDKPVGATEDYRPKLIGSDGSFNERGIMGLEELWKDHDAESMEPFAEAWLRELDGHSDGEDIGESVVLLGFTAPEDLQRAFIRNAVTLALTDDHLGHIAAGPVECLLSRHGEECISWFEEKSHADHAFARMMTGVRQHLMSDDVWKRVQAIQAGVDDPLNDSDEQGKV